METILVSACLLGRNTKYNGKNNYTLRIERIKQDFHIIEICPEVMGGLSTPRPASECRGETVINTLGVDVTTNFTLGAKKTLELVEKHQITKAILKESSPSCGTHQIYDGTFTGVKVSGMGVTAKLLKAHGVTLYSEETMEEIYKK